MDNSGIKVIGLIIFLKILRTYEQETDFSNNPTICGTEVSLEAYGKNSSFILDLSRTQSSTSNCSIRILAPENFLIHIQVLSDKTISEKSSNFTPDCPITVYNFKNNKQVLWSCDLCQSNKYQKSELMTSDLQVNWSKGHAYLIEKKLIFTALAIGEACEQADYYQCWHSGLVLEAAPVCVSRDLVCDGIVHCPTGTTPTDEDRHICRIRKFLSGGLETRVNNLYKKYVNDVKTNSLSNSHDNKNNWQLTDDNIKLINAILSPDSGASHEALSTEEPTLTDKITGNLTKYSPWSYITISMLLCGSVLTLCSFYRCVSHRRVKYEMARTHIIFTQPPVINMDHLEADTDTQAPPRYEDLELGDSLLPTYSSLFPKDCL